MEAIEADLCVIGGGAAGLAIAAGAAQLGAGTVLVERGALGGARLAASVPSHALLAAARGGDFAAARRHVRAVVATLAAEVSEERIAALGVRIIHGAARFSGAREIVVDGQAIRARRIVIATGAEPAIPRIAGLDTVPYLTSDTVFGLAALPGHLVVIAAEPGALVLAQAFRLLGARVTLLAAERALPDDDPELAELLVRHLRADGIDILEDAPIAGVERDGGGVAAVLEDGRRITGSHLLVAAGRRPALDGLDLAAAGIAASDSGLILDARLRTTNRRVFAAGDAAGGPQSSALAAHHAGVVLRNALFRLPARLDRGGLPRVIHTQPELAQVGLTEAEARARHGGAIAILRQPFAENDRALAERVLPGRATTGLVKLVTRRDGRILGAAILGADAGELIQVWALALAARVPLRTVARMMLPSPTRGEASKAAAAGFFAPRLFSGRTRRLVRFLARFG